MDGLMNKGKEMLNKNKSGGNSAPAGGQQSGAGNQDYGDKGVNAVEKKFGFDKDGKYDKYEEKGTDAARGQFEKMSGKNVPDKFSN